jgi:hypothetical protein
MYMRCIFPIIMSVVVRLSDYRILFCVFHSHDMIGAKIVAL